MPIIIRLRSKDGQFRINVEPTDDADKLLSQFAESVPSVDLSTLTFSNQPRDGPVMKAGEIRGNSIADLGLKHGHLLYATYSDKAGGSETVNAASSIAQPSSAPAPVASSTSAPSGSARAPSKKPWELVKEEPIDTYWSSQEAKIPRSRDSKFCRHGAQGMCDYCMPLEPYDAQYHSEHNIKHLSFHARLRKLNAGTNKAQGSSWIPPLEEEDYAVKIPCPSGQHPSWPAGICTKCQPSAITLQRQPYRMVDHVEFSHPDLIENLLKFWRSSASQRFGFLLGRYEPYADVPMGIKAVIEAIHEPPQEPELDGVTIGVPWEDQPRVEALAKEAGLQFVGMIYSDLTADTQVDEQTKKTTSTGKVLCKRHQDSFFLSGCEVLFAAALQNANSTPCRWSASGKFNSRFVTCVLTGNSDGEIGVEAYQVSEQAMAMVKADMIEASVNPNTIRVKPSDTGRRYVPEVFFRYKNEYGLDVKESARPTFPVEYLIVNVTNGFPTKSAPLFLSSKFPIENRRGLADQSTDVVFRDLVRILDGGKKEHIAPSDGDTRKNLMEWLSDWHLLAFLQDTGLVGEDEMKCMIKVATSHDSSAALDDLLSKPGWQTLLAIAKESAPAKAPGEGTWNSHGGGALDDDELTAEEIAAIIASTEETSIGGNTDNNTPAFHDSRSAFSSRRPSPPPAAPKPSTSASTSSAIARSATAIAPVDSGTRTVQEEYEWTGEDDGPIELDDDDDDDDGDDAFDDANSEVEEMLDDDDDDDDVQMTSAPSQTRASARTATTSSLAPSSARNQAASIVDLTQDDDSHDAGGSQKACPTCTVLNPADADSCYLCGLPMNV